MRYHYLDNIRWVTVLLVMFFHVFYYFNTYCMGSGIGGFSDYQPQDAVLYLLYPWLMPLLFVVAGMSSRYALQRKSPREYLRTRTRKLLVPATLGLFVFQWMAGYFGMQTMNFRFHADLGAGQPWWVMYIMWAVCGGGGLWFIQLLWLFSLISIPIYQVGSHLKQKAHHTLPTWLCALFLLLFGTLLYLTDRTVMDGDNSMQDPAMLYNVYRPLYYLTAYLFGYFFFVREEVQTLLVRLRWLLIPAALVCGIVLTITTFGEDAYSPAYIRSVGNNLYAWLAILAMFAAFRTWCNRDVSHINNANTGDAPMVSRAVINKNYASRLITFFRDASYGLYILQFFVYISIGYLLRAYTALPPWAMYVLLFLAMFILTPVLYLLIRRIPVLCYCVLGIKHRQPIAKKMYLLLGAVCLLGACQPKEKEVEDPANIITSYEVEGDGFMPTGLTTISGMFERDSVCPSMMMIATQIYTYHFADGHSEVEDHGTFLHYSIEGIGAVYTDSVIYAADSLSIFSSAAFTPENDSLQYAANIVVQLDEVGAPISAIAYVLYPNQWATLRWERKKDDTPPDQEKRRRFAIPQTIQGAHHPATR